MIVIERWVVQICAGFCLAGTVMLSAGCSASKVVVQQEPAVDRLQQAVAAAHRSAENVARDRYRHPYETLSFWGVREDMTVVEIWPGGGWYMEILAPFLRDKGHYIAAGFDQQSEVAYFREGAAKLKVKMDEQPEHYAKVVVTELGPPAKQQIAAPGTADRVLTFRNFHNWMSRQGYLEQVLQSMYVALKPGGVLGVVEHRGNPAVVQDPKAESGYVNEDFVIAQVEKAGFRLVERSEVNANPRDTKDHPNGVWTLPPTLQGHVNDSQYLSIGESDRMTLKFVKPE